MTFQGTAAD